MSRKILTASLIILSVVAAAFLLYNPKAKASINYNDLIDDAVFSNSGSMSAAQIDTFLNSFPDSCISQNPNGNGNPGFTTPDPTGWSASEPNNHGYTFGGNVTAGQAIYDAARIYNVNPQVILATMQKEQSIVTGDSGGCHYTNQSPGNACDYSVYNTVGGCVFIGMSYACPGSCDYSYNGFSLQLIAATWLLRFAQERSLGVTSGYAGYDAGDSNIGYYGPKVGVPDTLSGGNTVTPQTGGTASLYYFTPSENGGSEFDNVFTSWFGSLFDDFTIAVADSGNTTTQYLLYGSIKQAIASAAVKTDWGLGSYTPVTMSASVLNAIPNGPTLDRLFRVNGGSAVYFVDGGRKYWVSSSQMMAAWNNFDGAAIASVPNDLANVPTSAGNLTYNILSSGGTAQYMVDGGDGSNSNGGNGNIAIRQYPSTNVLQAFEGDNPGVTTITDTAYFNQMVQGAELSANSFTVTASGSSTQYQVVSGQKMYLSGTIAAVYNQTPETVSQATLNRLVTTSPASDFIRGPGNGVTIYMVDGGETHAVSSVNVLEAWLNPSSAINIVDNGYINVMPVDSPLSSYQANVSGQLYVMNDDAVTVPSSLESSYTIGTPYTASSALLSLYNTITANQFVKSTDGTAVYLMDNGSIDHIVSSGVYNLWSGGQSPTILTDQELAQYGIGPDITSNYVTNGTINAAVDGGTYYTVSNSVATDWGYQTPISINPATLSLLTSGGALSDTIRSGTSYYLMKYGQSHLTYNTSLAAIWGISTTGTNYSHAFVSTVPAGTPLTIFVTSASDSRIFVADTGGLLYYLNSPQQVQNYGYISGPMLQLSGADINAMTISNAQNIVEDGTSGNYAVLDGGSKRAFTTPTVQSYWLASGNQTSVSANLWSFIPSGQTIGDSIKGSAPNIYAIESGQKSWIQSWQTYSNSYAPYSNVSDYLIYLLPNGANIL